MWWRFSLVSRAALCSCLIATSVSAASGEASYEASPTVRPAAADTPTQAAQDTEVGRLANGKGFIYHPSRQPLGKFRFGLGAQYDAVDPAVMYGMNLRIPQLNLDARFGLGKGWSLKGHINTMLLNNEFLLGGAYAWRGDAWSVEGSFSVGAYLGKFAQLGFNTLFVSPEYRPELTIGYDLGDGIAISLRGSLLLMGPERVRVGEVWGGLDNSNLFVGHGEMLFVENTTSSGSVWYFALGAMTTRAYYQMWLLFPDAPGLYTYPRIMAGYEF